MRVSDFDFYLPEELIAQEPVEPRDASRLMVLHRSSGKIEHKIFSDIYQYVNAGDILVRNNTKVIPARLFGIKEGTGAKIEVFLLTRKAQDTWEVLVKPGKKAKPGTLLTFGEGLLTGEIIDTTDVGGRVIKFKYEGVFENILDELGQMPLPPYITKELQDPSRYQTVYARHQGSAAAPTAGLHFTHQVIQKLTEKGVLWQEVLLHVGLGTFRPVKAEDISDHKMHAEYFKVEEDSAIKINQAKSQGNKVFAIGTTSARVLESSSSIGGVTRGEGWTDIFIYPGYSFKVVDGMLTNFHLPKSTLLMLISALAGQELIMKAYDEAVKERYRFFSFGDAMLILP